MSKTVVRRGRGLRGAVVVAACAVVSFIVAASLAGLVGCSEGNGSAQGPSAEELTAWAQALDDAGADLEPASATYVAAIESVDEAAEKNAADLAKWDKEWKKRQAAYKKEVAEVEAYNASEQAKAKPSSKKMISEPVVIRFPDGRTMSIPAQYVSLPGYSPQLRSLPAKPKMPKKVKVKLADEVKRLKKLEARLGDLDARLAALVVGTEFAGVLSDMQTAIAALQQNVSEARKALKKAVKKDKKRGDVIATKLVGDLAAGDLEAQVAALHDALRQAADSAGVGGALTWGLSGSGASAAPSTSASASP